MPAFLDIDKNEVLRNSKYIRTFETLRCCPWTKSSHPWKPSRSENDRVLYNLKSPRNKPSETDPRPRQNNIKKAFCLLVADSP